MALASLGKARYSTKDIKAWLLVRYNGLLTAPPRI